MQYYCRFATSGSLLLTAIRPLQLPASTGTAATDHARQSFHARACNHVMRSFWFASGLPPAPRRLHGDRALRRVQCYTTSGSPAWCRSRAGQRSRVPTRRRRFSPIAEPARELDICGTRSALHTPRPFHTRMPPGIALCPSRRDRCWRRTAAGRARGRSRRFARSICLSPLRPALLGSLTAARAHPSSASESPLVAEVLCGLVLVSTRAFLRRRHARNFAEH